MLELRLRELPNQGNDDINGRSRVFQNLRFKILRMNQTESYRADFLCLSENTLSSQYLTSQMLFLSRLTMDARNNFWSTLCID